MIDELLDEFRKTTCKNCKGNCDKGVNISVHKNKVLLKCVDYKQTKESENIYTISLYKEIKEAKR